MTKNLYPKKLAPSADHLSHKSADPMAEKNSSCICPGSSLHFQFPYIPSDVPLDPRSFPHQPRGSGSAIPATLDNLRHLLSSYGINPRYNVISKGLTLNIPGLSTLTDTADQVSLSFLYSLANLNGISTGTLPDFVSAIASQNPYNPLS